MPGNVNNLPGTWVSEVTTAEGFKFRAIIVYTADGGMVERVTGSPDAFIGAWEMLPPGNDRFRSNVYGYHERLHPKHSTFTHTDRARVDYRLITDNEYESTDVTMDILNENYDILHTYGIAPNPDPFSIKAHRVKIADPTNPTPPKP
jgi:hypothetical protein